MTFKTSFQLKVSDDHFLNVPVGFLSPTLKQQQQLSTTTGGSPHAGNNNSSVNGSYNCSRQDQQQQQQQRKSTGLSGFFGGFGAAARSRTESTSEIAPEERSVQPTGREDSNSNSLHDHVKHVPK